MLTQDLTLRPGATLHPSQATVAVVDVMVKIGLIIQVMVAHILTRWVAKTITEVTQAVVGWCKSHGLNVQKKERQR